MKVLIDFDNTFFTDNRDVDDGLALMYLLGDPKVEVVGVTSTFGNSHIEEVDRCTRLLMEHLQLDLSLCRRGASECGDYLTEASSWIVHLANKYDGDLHILATGGMSNLCGAYLKDSQVFNKFKQIVVMGGKTEPLLFSKQEMLELNFSVDPHAAYILLTKSKNLSIMTGNNCLDLLFTRQQYKDMFAGEDGDIANLIQDYSNPWFRDNNLEYGIKGFYNWDTLAAAYLVNPEYFEDDKKQYRISVKSLSEGSLMADDHDPTSYASQKPVRTVTLNLPRIAKKEELKKKIYQNWLNLDKR